MRKSTFTILTVLAVILLLDYIWLGIIQKNAWGRQILDIQHSPLEFRSGSAILTYIIMTIVIVFLSIRHTKKDSILKDSIVLGFLTGLAMYGVFNGTNYSILKNYTLETALKDTSWGIFLSIISTYIGGRVYHS